jgi:hypothetical protein
MSTNASRDELMQIIITKLMFQKGYDLLVMIYDL